VVGLPCIVRNPRHYFSFQSRAKQRITLLVGSLWAEENPIKNYNFKKKVPKKKLHRATRSKCTTPLGNIFVFFWVLPGLPDSGHEKQMYHIGPNRPEARFDSDSQEGKAEFVVGRSKAQLV
jgi:hypothetical protein